jgi:hypothetical protein
VVIVPPVALNDAPPRFFKNAPTLKKAVAFSETREMPLAAAAPITATEEPVRNLRRERPLGKRKPLLFEPDMRSPSLLFTFSTQTNNIYHKRPKKRRKLNCLFRGSESQTRIADGTILAASKEPKPESKVI